ncbi:MAG TPA: protein-glutamate O-methyltransferase CheR [Anaeromyxobacter sp.]|nr:protein-glutamate O-methyltransferase CheR [Anaeromyxobacter sp.]
MSLKAAGVPLAEVERVLEEACGLTLSPGIRRTLGDAFMRAARDLRLAPEAFLSKLRAREHKAVTTLVEAAVVGETYFFRHPEQLVLIRQLAIAAAPRDRPLSIWSAGCATGEEPYTLAMELVDAGRLGLGDRILATDVSSRALAVAKEARYGEWSLRRLDPAVRNRHFESHPPQVEVRPEIRAMVEFRRHNLVRDPAPALGFDLVLCRNVLIYFNPPTAALVVEKLAVSLAPGGVLVLGPVETPLAVGQDLERVEIDGVTAFRAPGGRPLPNALLRPREEAPGAPAPVHSLAERRNGAAPRPAATPPPIQAAPPKAAPPPPPPPAAALATEHLEAARDAARRGDLSAAEELARAAAARELCPEAWLLVSMAADARGDLAGALDAARKALYLDPGLALGHATLVSLFIRLGLPEDAARARRNALEALAGLDDAAPLRGIENITAGALRNALEAPRPTRPPRVLTGSQG